MFDVFKTIPDFQYKSAGGSFKSWLLQLTAWRIGDQFRYRQHHIQRAKRLADSTAQTATVDEVPDPAGSVLEASWDKEWEQNLMNAATDRVKRTVDPKRSSRKKKLVVSGVAPVAAATSVTPVAGRNMNSYLGAMNLA